MPFQQRTIETQCPCGGPTGYELFEANRSWVHRHQMSSGHKHSVLRKKRHSTSGCDRVANRSSPPKKSVPQAIETGSGVVRCLTSHADDTTTTTTTTTTNTDATKNLGVGPDRRQSNFQCLTARRKRRRDQPPRFHKTQPLNLLARNKHACNRAAYQQQGLVDPMSECNGCCSLLQKQDPIEAGINPGPDRIQFEVWYKRKSQRLATRDPNTADQSDSVITRTVGICGDALADLFGCDHANTDRRSLKAISVISAENGTDQPVGLVFSDRYGGLTSPTKEIWARQGIGELHGYHCVLLPGNSNHGVTIEVLHSKGSKQDGDFIDRRLFNTGLAMSAMPADSSNDCYISGTVRVTIELHYKPVVFAPIQSIMCSAPDEFEDNDLPNKKYRASSGGIHTRMVIAMKVPEWQEETNSSIASKFTVSREVLSDIGALVKIQLERGGHKLSDEEFAATSLGIAAIHNKDSQPVVVTPIHSKNGGLQPLTDMLVSPYHPLVVPPGVSSAGKTFFSVKPEFAYKQHGRKRIPDGIDDCAHWLENGFGFALSRLSNYKPPSASSQSKPCDEKVFITIAIERFPKGWSAHLNGIRTVLLCGSRLQQNAAGNCVIAKESATLPNEMWRLILTFCDTWFSPSK